MRKILQHASALFIAILMFSGKAFTQSALTQQEKITDSLVQILIRQLNENNVDSMYVLFDESFKQKIPYNTFKNVFQNQVFTMSPFYNVQYKKSFNGLNSYQVQTKDGMFQVIAGLDSINKIKTFNINPYTGDLAADKYKRQEAM